jgi:ATP-binding cassette subfamily B protein
MEPDVSDQPTSPHANDVQTYLRLLREARSYWWHLGALFALNLLSAPIALLTPLPLKLAVDNVLHHRALPGFMSWIVPDSLAGSSDAILIIAALMVVAVALFDQFRYLASTVLSTYTGERLILDFRSRLFGHVQRLSFTYHDSKGTADSVYRIQNDSSSLSSLLLQGAPPLIGSAFTLLGMLYVTARLDWQLALVALAVCPLLVLITVASRKRQRVAWKSVKELESGAMSVIQEVLTGLRVVKAFAQEDRERSRFHRRADEGRRMRLRLTMIHSTFNLLFVLATAVGTAFVLYIGVRHVQSGRLTVGSLVLVIGYLAQLYLPAQIMSKTITDMQGALVSTSRVFNLLDELPDVPELPRPRPLARASGAISFQNVSFAYPNGESILRDVSLDVAPGTKVGIKGVTGAGKTTLVNLLSRFFDPTEGRLLLDSIDLREYSLTDLRRQFAIVLQEPVLFSTTIAENIAYARPDAAQDEIVEAAKAAHAHEFITALPAGYETLVGERGMRLSGGERQRISLARAFLKDAPILILDEPTSSVDVKTEAVIMEAMEHLMRGRTSLMIAHRLTTLDRCDAILEITNGRVATAVVEYGRRRNNEDVCTAQPE